MVTVSLVEDHAGTRDDLISVIARSKEIRLLAAYQDGEEALRCLPKQKPDVALVDINLPGMTGIECTAQLKKLLPDLAILMLTTYDESDLIFNSLRAGARGYLLKKMAPTELLTAIEQVYAGGSPMSMQVAARIVDYFHQRQQTSSELDTLTPREREILALLAGGFLYKEISDQLQLSFFTVRAHLRSIYEKLHVQSRKEATAKFLKSQPND